MESEISALRPPLMMQCSFFVHPPGHKIGLYDCEKFARFGMDANRPHEVAEDGRGEERERERGEKKKKKPCQPVHNKRRIIMRGRVERV